MSIRSVNSRCSASFPVCPDTPNRRPMVYSSKYPIASTSGRGIPAAPAHLATIENKFYQVLPVTRLQIKNQFIATESKYFLGIAYDCVEHARPAFRHAKCCRFLPTFPNDLCEWCKASTHRIKWYKYPPNMNWKIQSKIFKCQIDGRPNAELTLNAHWVSRKTGRTGDAHLGRRAP